MSDTTRTCRRSAGLAALLLVAACGGGPSGSTAPPPSTLPTPQLGALRFGYAVSAEVFDDPTTATIVEADADVVTPENAMKWDALQPERGVYDFDEADRIVAAARDAGQTVRGHVLVWHRQLPDWLEGGDWTRDELAEVLVDHVTTVVDHFRSEFPGVVTDWDVVNEAVSSDGAMRDSIWFEVLGEDYLRLAFEAARAADPDATLWINDYLDDAIVGVEPRPGASSACITSRKCHGLHQLVRRLVDVRIPVDGVGFQGHIFDLDPPDYTELAAWVGPLGLRWALTEVDVALPSGRFDDPALLAAQADAFGSMVDACATAPNCDTLVVWGVSDAGSWIPDHTDGALGAALLYDEEGRAKPVRDVVLAAVDAAR